MTFVAPSLNRDSFTCPHCGVFAMQRKWGYHDQLQGRPVDPTSQGYGPTTLKVSRCDHCQAVALWFKGALVFPIKSPAPKPNPEMPADAKADYEEAAGILNTSPRGAAALLRLSIQRLCVHLGGKGKNLNDDIRQLVEDGLPEKIRKSLDVVRVTGNNAVHPGQMTDIDDPKTAEALFPLVNLIVESMIALPKKIEALHEGLPEGAKEAIEKRDGKPDNEGAD